METEEIKLAIVASMYHSTIAKSLIKHCVSTLESKGVRQDQIEIFKIPGSLEIPLIAKKLAQKKIYDAIIVFGVVLKGKTYHFEQVANECVRGCMQVSYDYEIPVIFEVLPVYDLQDAIARATGKKDNRGVEGALTALRMIEIMRKL